MKKIKIILIGLIIIILLTATILILGSKSNLVKLNYNEVIEKLKDKETFVLCISAKDCIHCQNYKPKLKKISNQYKIKIYYIDTDTIDKDNYDEFKKQLNFDGSTPVTLFIKDGEEKTTATRINGDASSRTIISKLKTNGFIE